MSVCAFNSLFRRDYSNLFIVAFFPSKSFSGIISLTVKNLYLPTFSDKKSKIITSNTINTLLFFVG